MLIVYTMPRCEGCKTLTKRLRTWHVDYEEHQLNLWQNMHPGKIWSAPILDTGEKYFEWEQINTRDKLWRVIEEYEKKSKKDATSEYEQHIRTREEMRKIVKDTIKKRMNKTKYDPTLTMSEEANDTVKDQMNTWIKSNNATKEIETYFETLSELEQIAFMIGFRLARHSEAMAWRNKGIEAMDRARMLDP